MKSPATLRILTGSAKGHHIRVPEHGVRPTPNRVRESLFNILHARIPGARVLDAFAGSGALGIEALSRGASFCLFVDHNRNALKVVEENLKSTKLLPKAALRRLDTWKSAGILAGTPWDLVLVDPPYAQNRLNPNAVMTFMQAMGQNDGFAKHALIMMEHPADFPLTITLPEFREKTRRRFGMVGLRILEYLP